MGCGLDRFQGSPAPLGLAARFRIIAQDGNPARQEENYLMSSTPELMRACRSLSKRGPSVVDCSPTEGSPAKHPTNSDSGAANVIKRTQPELKRWPSWTHCTYPTESLTWDDVCQLWDNGVHTAEDIKNIASLYFEGPELSAVREVIEKVESDSHTLEQ
jgi:hypothetical protein